MADKWNAAATNSQIIRKYWQASGVALSITRVGNFMKKMGDVLYIYKVEDFV